MYIYMYLYIYIYIYIYIGKQLIIILINLFFMLQFNCCLLIWMGYSRAHNRKISFIKDRVHERCLRIIYNIIISHHL